MIILATPPSSQDHDNLLNNGGAGSHADISDFMASKGENSGLASINSSGYVEQLPANFYESIHYTISGGGSAITAGLKEGAIEIPFDCTITGWSLYSCDSLTTSGSIVLDLWLDSYANYPPAVADTLIPTGTKPTISSSTKGQSSSMSGWTTSLTKGKSLRINVDSCTSIKAAVLVLLLTRV